MSTADSWVRLEALFDHGVTLPPDARLPWLEQVAADDPQLLAQLQRMFAAHEATGVLDHGVLPLPATDLRARLGLGLADRFELQELLGRGGMSSVFRAHELKHDRTVVIKALQPGLAAAIGPHRFADEVRIAARLSHPHILALIDSGEADGIRYFVMPHVGGTTLRERLAAEGALSVASAITLLRDIADALAHAHDAGVVHRDLKPENVLCVGDHAFLLDFGVAKLEGTPHSGATDPGFAIGTPGYMAPEQAAGTPVDHRADIYVWGLLAREILTGRRDPSARVSDRADVPLALRALVDATLATDPVERPASARSLVAALDAMLAPVRPRRRRAPMVAALTVVGLAGWLLFGRRDTQIPMDQLAMPIAVAPLSDETGDSSLVGIGRLAGDWITQGLHETGSLRVVAWPAARTAVELDPAAGPAEALRKATGAATVVTGTVYRVGDSLRFAAEVVDAERALVLAAPLPVTVHHDSAVEGVRLLRDRVMGAFAVQQDERLVAGASFADRPPTYQAYRAFDLALSDFDAYRYAEARDGMIASWRLDTTFTAALVYAAYATWNMSNESGADSLVHEVLARRSALSPHHLALAEQIAASLRGDAPAALAAVRRAVDLAPGSRARYNLALILASLNRPTEALAQLDSLNPDRGPMRGWPAYWSQRAYAEHLLGHHDRELVDARTMAARHPNQRVTGVIEARVFGATHQLGALDSLLRRSEPLPPDVYWSQGAMRVVAAEELVAHGWPEAGTRYFVEAERWLRARLALTGPDESHRYWLSSALVGQRRWHDAEVVVTDLLRDRPDRLLYRGLAASLAARRGDSARAAELLADEQPWEKGEMMLFRARVAAVQGNADQATAYLGEALRTGLGAWHWTHGVAWNDFAEVRHDPRFQRLVAGEADR